jgi:dephospho-CoA kinase
MVILGLTGSIAMGKSTAAAMLRRLGVPVYDADRAVHRALAPGGAAVAKVAAAFPQAAKGKGIDRAVLGALVFDNPSALRRLERILHPLARRAQQRFLRMQAARRARLVVLDIPLLLESRGGRFCDAIVVVSAPAFLQRQRALKRPGMSEARLAAILAHQMPDAAKRRRADFTVETGIGKRHSLRRLARIVRLMRKRLGDGKSGRYWPPRPRFRKRGATED